jgi:hypothetical protein
MNRLILAPVLAAAFAAPVFADDITPEPAPIVSSATRAQVQAELQQFKQGANPWSQTYNPLASFRGQRTRADVQAEYLRSRDEVAALTSEDSGSAYLAIRTPAAAPVLAGQPVNAQ